MHIPFIDTIITYTDTVGKAKLRESATDVYFSVGGKYNINISARTEGISVRRYKDFMKILYCGIASKFIHTMPAGWFLCEYLRQKGIGTNEIYHNVNEPIDTVVGDIRRLAPDMLLLSVYIFNVKYIKELTARIRAELPNCKIVLGGPEADETLNADHIIMGEGEEALYRLVSKGGPKMIYGEPQNNLDTLFSPYTFERLSASRGKMIYYESSRGCPFACSYCMAGQTKGVRYFGVERVKSDLEAIAASGAKIIKFTDRTFNANAKRTDAVFRYILDRFGGGDVRFHFEVGGDLFGDSTLRLLAQMPPGLIQLEAGVQTLNPESLKAVNRVFDPLKFIDNIKRITDKGNVHLHLDLIAGLPQDTLESFKMSFNTVYALRPHMLQLGFLKFLKGTPIRGTVGARYSNEPPYEVISTPTMSESDLAELKEVEKALKIYNGWRFAATLEYLLSKEASPYALYLSLAGHFRKLNAAASGDYALQSGLLSYKGGLPEVKELLRLDYLSNNAVCKMPALIKRPWSEGFKSFIKHHPAPSGKAYDEFAYLPEKGEGVYIVEIDYTRRDRVTGRYPHKIII